MLACGLSVAAVGRAAAQPPAPPGAVPSDADVSSRSFAEWLTELRAEALSRGIRPAVVNQALDGLELAPTVIERDRKQAEFTLPLDVYITRRVTNRLVRAGRRMAAAHAALLERVSARYGVPSRMLVAVWGLESNFGNFSGVRPVISTLATLAHDQRRGAFFRGELLQALTILDRGDIDLARMKGSWAGAMGQTQFIPTVFLQYAKDGNGDGKRNLWDTRADVFASTANYLSEKGWQEDAPCFDEVRLPQGFDYGIADISIEKSVREWADLSITLVSGRALSRQRGQDMDAPAAIILPAGYKGPAFIAYPNFKVVLAYNNAISYALAICELSVRFKGGPNFRTPWPRDEQPLLSRADRVELQTLLAQRKYDVGEADGVIGRKTREAIRAYQRSQGLPPDGFATQTLLASLRQPPNGAGQP